MLSEKIERYLAIVEDRLRALPYQPTDEDLEGRTLAIWLCEQVQQLQAENAKLAAEVAALKPDALLGAARHTSQSVRAANAPAITTTVAVPAEKLWALRARAQTIITWTTGYARGNAYWVRDRLDELLSMRPAK